MKTFTVSIRSAEGAFAFIAIGSDSAAVHMAAVDQFGVCAITVKLAGVKP